MYAFGIYLWGMYTVLSNMIGMLFIARAYTATIVPALIGVVINWKLLPTTFCKTCCRDWQEDILSFVGVYRNSGNYLFLL